MFVTSKPPIHEKNLMKLFLLCLFFSIMIKIYKNAAMMIIYFYQKRYFASNFDPPKKELDNQTDP